MERWYGPQAQYLRSVNDMFGEVGDEGPLGSDKDLGLYWNVAVSNVIQPIDRNWLPVQTQLGEVTAIVEVPLVPGGLMLTPRGCNLQVFKFRGSLEALTVEYTPFRVADN